MRHYKLSVCQRVSEAILKMQCTIILGDYTSSKKRLCEVRETEPLHIVLVSYWDMLTDT